MTVTSRALASLITALLAVAVVVKATSFGSPYIAVTTLVVGALFVGGVISLAQTR